MYTKMKRETKKSKITLNCCKGAAGFASQCDKEHPNYVLFYSHSDKHTYVERETRETTITQTRTNKKNRAYINFFMCAMEQNRFLCSEILHNVKMIMQ